MQEIRNYIKAGNPGLYLIGSEEKRVELELKAIAKALDFSLYTWSIGSDITNPDNPSQNSIPETDTPEAMLDRFAAMPERSILLAKDLHLFFADANPLIIRKVKDALAIAKQSNRVLVILGCQLKMQPELEKELVVLDYKLPGREQLETVLRDIARDAGIKLNGSLDSILDAASGLTTTEAENAFALSFVETGDILAPVIAREKANTVKKNGILEIIETKETLDSIGGLENLKGWLVRRKSAFGKKAKEYGLPTPKGVLAVGIAGTGKSLSAKACASILSVPLVKLDAGKIFGSLVGQSEQNLRTALQTAEAISPCVLWIDELEKAFAGSKSSGQTDGGTTSRVFGAFLQWMNDKTSPVFVFATANDISQLPPEFLRKGRFDELFFVDLPNEGEREQIWKIQIAKHGRNPADFDVSKLSGNSTDFTGAEIEAAFTDAMFSAFDENKEVSTPYVVHAIGQTVPLAKTMGEQITALRNWAKGRARLASLETSVTPKVTRKIINN